MESASWPPAGTWIKTMWSFYPVIKKNEVLTISEKMDGAGDQQATLVLMTLSSEADMWATQVVPQAV